MKLDVLISSLHGGGAERAAANLSSGWAKAGHEVRLVTLEPLSEVEYHPDPNVKLVSIAAGKKATRNPLTRILSRLLLLRRTLTGKDRADLIIAIQANLAIDAALACSGTGVKIIGCERNIPSRAVRGRLWTWLRPFAYRKLATVMTQTDGSAVELKPICGAVPIRVVPNILGLPLADNPPRLVPDEIVDATVPLLLAVGRLVPAKGFDILIKRFAGLTALDQETRLIILGDGPMRAELEAQIRNLQLEGRILMPGRAGNVAQWYARAQLFMMTSRWEGMPMVLIEAMGHGAVPVVTDFHHGPRDVIRNGIDGVILPEDDSSLWIETTANLLSDPQRRAEMRTRALEVRDRFGEEAIMKAWARILEEVSAR